MKKINMKSLMLMTFLLASVIAMPNAVAAYGTDDDNYNFTQMGSINPGEMIGMFDSGFGSMFGQMGDAGRLIGAVFQMLLMKGLENFSQSELLPGVFVLSASYEKDYNGTKNFGSGVSEYYFAPYQYQQNISQINENDGMAYCLVNKTGYISYKITVGAAVTLVIWDHDGSFIRAVNKIVSFFQKLRVYMNRHGENYEGIPEDLIREGIATITWFLVHINDIFTGDELFTLNPISWQKINITTSSDFNITKTWYLTRNDWQMDCFGGPVEDKIMEKNSTYAALLQDWLIMARKTGDSQMQWLLTPSKDIQQIETLWTSFSFDLIQLWVKNFEIHIDFAELMNALPSGSGDLDIAKIFQGLDIEFYLFTHHLAGAFLYNDTDANGNISVKYGILNDTSGNPVKINNTEVKIPIKSEITHRLILNEFYMGRT
ncbi:MAG: hypothetical protein ACTSO4_18615 [Promethearchaeota archaeon]